MKTIIQNYSNGEMTLSEVPVPALGPGGVLVRTEISLVSAGTERLMVELARKSLLGKAVDRPDLVRQVMDKVKREGLLATVETVRRRLDAPMPLGYSSAGRVIEVGQGVSGFKPGDRVACAGAGYANHAEVAFVPQNLIAALPDNVDFEVGACTTVGAIALQGFRLAECALGETVVVIGLGLLGLMTVQIAKAAGCRVVGMDPDSRRADLAGKLGAEDTVTDEPGLAAMVSKVTSGHGADAVLITAGTKSNGPVALAGAIAREKGIVVAVGAVGLEIPRKPYYEKELTFRISRSYGPGRYDDEYEQKGRDYPIGYVRWTENRNMQAFLGLAAQGKIDVHSMITHRFPFERALDAYGLITGKAKEPYLGVLLTFSGAASGAEEPGARRVEIDKRAPIPGGKEEPVEIGVLGAGLFATSTLLPAMKRVKGLAFRGLCAATGIHASHAARKFGFAYASTDENEVIGDPETKAVVIATRHNLHARQVVAALRAGKHIFCEKPLCLNEGELSTIEEVFEQAQERASLRNARPPVLMVGYNRRFAPLAVRMKSFLNQAGEPIIMNYRVNAGFIPLNHWIHDPEQGGGRIIGEVCHFVDFLTYLNGSLPVGATAHGLPNGGRYRDDNAAVHLQFENGSVGTIVYAANGDKSFPKERVEVFGGGMVAVMEDFRRLDLIQKGRRRTFRSRLTQDKGYKEEWKTFARSLHLGSADPIPVGELIAVMRATLNIAGGLR